MKNLLLTIALAFLAQLTHAQVLLEHTYPKGKLERIRLDVSGERYLSITQNTPTGQAWRLYDSYHEDLGIVFYPDPYMDLLNSFLSETLLDDDPEVEMLYSWMDGSLCNGYSATILEENGGVNGAGQFDGFIVSSGQDLDPKLVCFSRVYGLPGQQLEHDYGNYTAVQRMPFPIGGERFIVSDWNVDDFDGFHIHDANHNWLNSINFSFENYRNFKNFTQQFFNDDALLEVYGTTTDTNPDANGNDRLFQIVQEDGTVLFSELCTGGHASILSDLPGRVLIYQYVAPGEMVTRVLDAKTFGLLNVFPGAIVRFSPDGVKDYYRSTKVLNNSLTIYDGSTFASKEIDLGFTLPDIYYLRFTRNRFSHNGKLELFYKSGDGIIWIDEDGALLHTFEYATDATIDQQPDMEDKLFVRYPDSIQVYDFLSPNSAVPTLQESPMLTAVPNPFSTSVEVEFPQAGDYSVQVTDVVGHCVLNRKVYNQEKTTLQIPANVPDGLYFVSVKSGGLLQSMKLLKGQ